MKIGDSITEYPCNKPNGHSRRHRTYVGRKLVVRWRYRVEDLT